MRQPRRSSRRRFSKTAWIALLILCFTHCTIHSVRRQAGSSHFLALAWLCLLERIFALSGNAEHSGDRLRIALLIASGLDAIVEVERMLRASASHVHVDAAQSCDVDTANFHAIEERLIVGGDRADGSRLKQRAQKRLGNVSAIFRVGAAENLVDEEENRAILLCGVDGLLQTFYLCEELRLAVGERVADTDRRADGEEREAGARGANRRAGWGQH